MKKILLIIICFIVSFCITLYFTFPYKSLYQNYLNNIKYFSCHVKSGNLFSVKIKDIYIQIKKTNISLDKINIQWNPILFILNKPFLHLEIYKKNQNTILFLKKQNDNFIITGDIPIKLIKSIFKNYSTVKMLKKDISIFVKLNYKNKQININSIHVAGDFILKGKGYIKKHFIVFNGRFEYQNFKKNVSYYLRI